MSDITKIMEAYLGMVSGPQEETLEEAVNMGPWNRGAINKAMSKAGIKGPQAKAFIAALRVSGTVAEEVEADLDEACGKKSYKEGQEECPKCKGKGCDHCDGKGVHEKKLDPVDDKANDKKFADRKDKDIDNDGDVDSSDEYLHKRRKATDDAIDGGKKPAKEAVEDEEESEDDPKDKKKKPFPPKKKDDASDVDAEDDAIDPKDDEENPVKKNPKTADKKAEISKIEGVDFSGSFADMWAAFGEAIDPKKGALAGEKYDDHSSDHDKKVIGMHKKSDKKVEDEEEDSHTKTFKAGGKDMKQAPARSGADKLSNGDKKVINPVKGK